MLTRSEARARRARSLLLEGSTGLPLLDQPFIFICVWSYLDASDKKALRQGSKRLRLAVDEQVQQAAWLAIIWLALFDDHQPAEPPAKPSFFKAAGQRWPNIKRIALSRAADVQTLLSPSNNGGHAAFPRLQAMTVGLVGAWLLCSPRAA